MEREKRQSSIFISDKNTIEHLELHFLYTFEQINMSFNFVFDNRRISFSFQDKRGFQNLKERCGHKTRWKITATIFQTLKHEMYKSSNNIERGKLENKAETEADLVFKSR